MALMLAGLRGVDDEIWKASRVDGIPKWRTYVFIVIPMMRPVFVTALVIVAAGIVRTYDLVVAMTGGGPGLSSQFPTIYVYEYMFVVEPVAGPGGVDGAAGHGRRSSSCPGRSTNSAGGERRHERDRDERSPSPPSRSGPKPKRRFAPATIMRLRRPDHRGDLLPHPALRDDRDLAEGPATRSGSATSSRRRSSSPSSPGSRRGPHACTGLYCEGLQVGFWKSV